MKTAHTSPVRILLAFIAIYVIWGTTYLAVRIGIETIPPFMMGAMRYTIAGILFLLYAWYKKERLSPNHIFRNILLGAVMQTGGQAILFWCEKYISSGLAAILVAAEPLWFIVLDKLQWQFYFKSKRMLIGIVIGFAGIIVLFSNLLHQTTLPGSNTSLQLFAAIAALLSGCVWAGCSLYFTYTKREGSLHVNLGWQLVGGIIGCIIISVLSSEFTGFNWQQVSGNSALCVLYLAVAGSIVAFSSYNWLLTQKPAAVVGTYAYINPVIAVLVGCVLASEQLFISQVAGMLIILVSAWLVNKAGADVNRPHAKAVVATANGS